MTTRTYEQLSKLGIYVALACAVIGCGSVDEDPDAEFAETTAETKQAFSVASGFSEQYILTSPSSGIRLYKHASKNEWVTIVDLRYASLRSVTGTVSGSDPNYRLVQRNYGSTYWTMVQNLQTSTRRAKVLVSGTFGAFTDPSGVAFGLKKDGSLISYGYASPGGPQPEGLNTKLFTVNNPMQRAWIGSYNSNSFSVSPDVVGALDVLVDKNAYSSIGRTFVGVRDEDGNGSAETVMFFSSSASTQANAASVLSAFGAQQQAMLDGSGSTFFGVEGVMKIPSSDNRRVMHAIGIYSGK